MGLLKFITIFFSQKNTWNIFFLIVFFPIYLYQIKTTSTPFYILDILGLIILIIYLFALYKSRLRFYQVPLHFIISSILFMQVIRGGTIPIALIVIVLGIILFFLQDIISNEEYKNSEIMRQIVLSGIIFMTFSTYAFLFGSIFINSISPIILSFISLVATFNIVSYVLWIYGTEFKYYMTISILTSIIITQIFIGIRILPFTHLTQSMILTIYLIFSISIFRDIYFKILDTKKTLSRLILIIILFLVLIFTSLT